MQRTLNNRTSRYVVPMVRLFGKTFYSQIDSLTNYVPGTTAESIMKYSIMDLLYYRAKQLDKFNEYLFVTFDVRGTFNTQLNKHVNKELGKRRFLNFLKYIRSNSHYVDDYWDRNFMHVVVLKMPIKISYEKFLVGEYSKMYSTSELKELGFSPTINVGGKKLQSADYVVLSGAKELGLKVLKSVVYENFGTDMIPDEPDEYDIPWLIQDEILNWELMTEFEKEQIQLMKKKKEYYLYDQSRNISRFN